MNGKVSDTSTQSVTSLLHTKQFQLADSFTMTIIKADFT